MFKEIKISAFILIILFFLSLLINSNKIGAQTQETTAQVIGKFVDEGSGKTLRIEIYAYTIDYPEGITSAAKVEFDSLISKIEWKFEYDSTKAFMMTFENAVPGTYSLLGRLGRRDLGLFTTVYGVEPGKVVDVGVITVKKK